LKGFFHPQIDRFVGLNERPIEIKDDPPDSFSEVVEDLLETLEKVAGDVFVDTIGIERIFGEYKIGFLGSTAIRDAIPHIEDGLVLRSMGLNQSFLARPTAATLLVPIGIGEGLFFSRAKGSNIGIEWNLSEMMDV
jgi:hypothetical protein